MNGQHIMVRPVWALTVIATCVLLVSGLGIAYTNYNQQRADQRWCSLLQLADRPARPELTAEQKQGLAELHKLRLSLGC